MHQYLIPELSTRPVRFVTELEGGFGKVLIVEDADGSRHALKTLKWHLGLDRQVFADEVVSLASACSHPNVVPLSGVYWVEGDPYMVMPYYPTSLAGIQRSGAPLPAHRVADIILAISGALHHAHTIAGRVHLDIKPANVLLSATGVPVLSDFGIARALPKPKPNGVHRDLFLTGLTGTLAYMSPEQLVGGPVSTRSDVFAVGIMAYESLTGEHPFLTADVEGTVRNILRKDAQFGLHHRLLIPGWLRALVLSCLAKNATDRPTAKDLLEGLSSEGYSAPPVSPVDVARNVNRATSLAAVGRVEEAVTILQQCIEENPLEVLPLVNLAFIRFSLGDAEEALRLSEQAYEIAKWLPIERSTASTLMTNLANHYLPIDPQKAVKAARAAVQLDKNDWQALGNLAESARAWGEARGDFELLREGQHAVRQALQLNPDDLKLQITDAGLHLAMGDLKQAWARVTALVNAHGADDIPLRMLLITVMVRTGRIEEALKWVEPMRRYAGLAAVVEAADQEIDAYRRLANSSG